LSILLITILEGSCSGELYTTGFFVYTCSTFDPYYSY
jgi:hypothetical protein